MTAYRDFGRKQKREVSLEYLISETPLEPFTTDTYFEQLLEISGTKTAAKRNGEIRT